MRAARVILIGVILAALMVPLVCAINFIGATNFVATHGGNVTFAQNFQAYSLTYAGGLNHFTNLVWGGYLRGNLGFDADAGVNMTVTNIAQSTVSYTVATLAPGNVQTYIYYYRAGFPNQPGQPTSVTGGTFTYSQVTGIATVTTTGGAATVTVNYASEGAEEQQSLMTMVLVFLGVFAMVPLVFAAFYIYSVIKSGEEVKFSQMVSVIVIVVVAFLILAAMLKIRI